MCHEHLLRKKKALGTLRGGADTPGNRLFRACGTRACREPSPKPPPLHSKD